jgi:hypothetical protein
VQYIKQQIGKNPHPLNSIAEDVEISLIDSFRLGLNADPDFGGDCLPISHIADVR